MVLVAPPDAGRGRRRVPRRRAGLARVRALGPAAGAGGRVVRRPGGGSPRNPRCPLRSKVILLFFRIAVVSSWVWSWLGKFFLGSCWFSTSVRLVTVSLSDMILRLARWVDRNHVRMFRHGYMFWRIWNVHLKRYAKIFLEKILWMK